MNNYDSKRRRETEVVVYMYRACSVNSVGVWVKVKKRGREGQKEKGREGERERERFSIVETHGLSLTETRHDQIGHPCTHHKCLLNISLPAQQAPPLRGTYHTMCMPVCVMLFHLLCAYNISLITVNCTHKILCACDMSLLYY